MCLHLKLCSLPQAQVWVHPLVITSKFAYVMSGDCVRYVIRDGKLFCYEFTFYDAHSCRPRRLDVAHPRLAVGLKWPRLQTLLLVCLEVEELTHNDLV